MTEQSQEQSQPAESGAEDQESALNQDLHGTAREVVESEDPSRTPGAG